MDHLKDFNSFNDVNEETIWSKMKYRLSDEAGPEETVSWLFDNENEGLRKVVSEIKKAPNAMLNQNFLKLYFKNKELTGDWKNSNSMTKDFIALVMNGDYAFRRKVASRIGIRPGGTSAGSQGVDPIDIKDIKDLEEEMRKLMLNGPIALHNFSKKHNEF